MNERQRFLATMRYEPRDRCPICDFSFWPETIDLWREQGLPAWVGRNYDATTQMKFFGTESYSDGPGGNPGMHPSFESRVLEDLGDEEIVQDGYGVSFRRHKTQASIPMYLDHTLKDRASWEKHFKWRFDGTDPKRFPSDWDAARKVWNDPEYPAPRRVWMGSFYGWIRDMMGVEGVSYIVYDDPALFEEMVVTMTDCKVAVLQRLLAEGGKFDVCSMWEDMCYNAGPLLSPEHFKRYLVPQMKRVTEPLRAAGCTIIYTDCDGKIDELIPLWLDAGVNCMFPIEVGTWGADPVAYRRQYGRELLMMGGFGKATLAAGPRAIEREVLRLAPLVEEGGYIPMPDHRVPPDVTFESYLYYLKAARRVWGRDLPNLKPLGEPEPVAARD